MSWAFLWVVKIGAGWYNTIYELCEETKVIGVPVPAAPTSKAGG